MNRVQLLSEQVANQIAAGEVIERPASVVKELVENSIDAGASRITVETHAGGRSLMRVTDDGSGMNKDDALLCLERHATSKIREAADLFEISTMGFRGEALPSISSVSRFTLTTRDKESDEATQVIINGGKIATVKSAGAPIGTSIEVRQLFFNIPARRKFLRTEETERSHIQHYLTLAALAHPRISFTLMQNGRTTLQLAGVKHEGEADCLKERIRNLHGNDLKLLELDESGHYEVQVRNPDEEEYTTETQVRNLHLWGFIGSPGVSRSTRADQNLFVNRRPVENRGMNAALIEGYHTVLMKGRFPVCCLFLEIDPMEVDVNIHPAKREVKFHQERRVRKFVADALKTTLLKFHSSSLPAPTQLDPTRATELEFQTGASANAPAAAPTSPGSSGDMVAAPDARPDWPAPPRQEALPMGFSRAPDPSASADTPGVPYGQTSAPAQQTPLHPVPLLAVPLRLVGVINRLYVVLESDRGLVLMDQHAAHERVLFEQMLERMEKNENAPSQRLLLPETIELTARDTEFVKSQVGKLNRLGVELNEFGERTFLLEALPPFIKVPDPKQFTMQMIDQLKAAGDGVNNMRLGEDMVAKTVCRHAVKANDPLADAELENLVNDLRHCTMPYTCPHGRPTLIEMSMGELEKKFGRIQ
jgi:DNA mismatch repair protein MutL